jgi:hypothetical protein
MWTDDTPGFLTQASRILWCIIMSPLLSFRQMSEQARARIGGPRDRHFWHGADTASVLRDVGYHARALRHGTEKHTRGINRLATVTPGSAHEYEWDDTPGTAKVRTHTLNQRRCGV